MTTATATFHRFPHLSPEVRARIWELTVEPRIVEVRVVYYRRNPPTITIENMRDKRLAPMRHLRSSTAAPAQLQTCREAREHLSRHPDIRYQYKKAFSEIAITPYGGFVPVSEDDPERERYVWFNFNNDMVSIGDTYLDDIWAIADQVRRLRLKRDLDEQYFFYTESQLISRWFRNICEIHLISLQGIGAGHGIADNDNFFPCKPENVYIIDSEDIDGKMISCVDLDALREREWEDWAERERRERRERGEPEELIEEDIRSCMPDSFLYRD